MHLGKKMLFTIKADQKDSIKFYFRKLVLQAFTTSHFYPSVVFSDVAMLRSYGGIMPCLFVTIF